MNDFPHHCIRRCALSLPGRAHSVVNANGGLNWFIIRWKFKTVNRIQNRINNSSVHIKTVHFLMNKHPGEVGPPTHFIKSIWAFMGRDEIRCSHARFCVFKPYQILKGYLLDGTGSQFWFRNTCGKVKSDLYNWLYLQNAMYHFFWGTLYMANSGQAEWIYQRIYQRRGEGLDKTDRSV